MADVFGSLSDTKGPERPLFSSQVVSTVIIEQLEIKHLRCIEEMVLNVSSGFNLILGGNGAGKTTVLEAIYLAGRGRSFRHADAGPLIRRGEEQGEVVLRTLEPGSNRRSVIGVRRSTQSLRCRINGEEVRKRSTLAENLPVQWIGSQPQLLLDGGPEVRRRFIDMGLFHVEHGYLAHYHAFNRALRQRNAALRAGSSSDFVAWEHAIAGGGEYLTERRLVFVDQLMSNVGEILSGWMPGVELSYRYRIGWPEGEALQDALARRREADLRAGYSTVGPQRADLAIKVGGTAIEKTLSRGQQKLVVFAFHLALRDSMLGAGRSTPIVLIDDLDAEFDRANRTKVIDALVERNAQVFLARIDGNAVSLPQATRMFHVEQGRLTVVSE